MATDSTNVRFEAPAAGALSNAKVPTGRASEPTLEIDQIQGNIFPGFSKDHQSLIFLQIDNPAAFRVWLGDFAPKVATTEDVLAFGRVKSDRRSG